MNFTCIICSDIIVPSADIYTTSCGHLFHYPCLIQWIERSPTCPQCRQKSTLKSIHRVYFNLANTDHLQEDSGVLQNKVDNLEFQLKLKEKDITTLKQKYQKFKKANAELRLEISALEEKQKGTDSVVYGLREKLKFFKEQLQEKERLTAQIASLKSELRDVEIVQLAINGSRDEVNNMLRNEDNVESLALLAATLKKALLDAEKKKSSCEYKAKQLHNELNSIKREKADMESQYNELKSEYEIAKIDWKKEKDFLSQLISGINKDTPTRNKINSAIPLKRILSESPMPLPKRPFLDDSKGVINLDASSSTVEEKVLEILDSHSPYLPVKTNSLGINFTSPRLKVSPTKKIKAEENSANIQMSIFKPKPRQFESTHIRKHVDVVNYGLGGHSRAELYPSPKKSLATIKRPRTTTLSSAKLKKLTPNAKK